MTDAKTNTIIITLSVNGSKTMIYVQPLSTIKTDQTVLAITVLFIRIKSPGEKSQTHSIKPFMKQ